ncbi:MAG: Yip1 family protein [Sulfuricella sp.]|nr:Yip1 family protein [Sulfuricella sp.]
MNMLHLPEFHAWDTLSRRHLSVPLMFFFYVLPMSLIPALMLYYAGTAYHENLLPALSLTASQLQILSGAFFVYELAGVFAMAGAVEFVARTELKVIHSPQKLMEFPPEAPSIGEPVDVPRVEFRDAFTLAAIAPTPLWIGSLCLFIPSFMIDMTIGALALLASAVILYYATPTILKLDEQREGALFRYLTVAGGMVGWAAMMYLTLLTWSIVTSSLTL